MTAYANHAQKVEIVAPERLDKARFKRLVRAVSADVYRYAFWLCRDRSVAEELTQEAYLRAWKHFDSLTDEGAIKSWLFTIVRREHARRLARKRLDVVDGIDIDAIEADKDYDTSTEAVALRRALKELPEEYREPLILQVIGGYSGEEIGVRLDLTPEAVMTRLFRARRKLREMLEDN